MKIALLDDYQDLAARLSCFSLLAEHTVIPVREHVGDTEALARRIADCEALMLIRQRTAIPRKLLERLPRLRLISLAGPTTHVDLRACAEFGVTVCSHVQSAQPSYATAELAWGLAIAAWRRIPQESLHMRSGNWQSQGSLGAPLRGRTLGIHGYGRIGAVVAGYGRAFGMRVLAWGGAGSLERAAKDGIEAAAGAEALYAESDVLSLHLSLTPATEGIVTGDLLGQMKPTAVFVNTSRAQLVERGALARALEAGRPGSAAVDVFDSEPVDVAAEPLLALDNVVATPHLGYVVRDGLEAMFRAMVEQVLAFDRGAPVDVVRFHG